jgi:hypothetical protein
MKFNAMLPSFEALLEAPTIATESGSNSALILAFKSNHLKSKPRNEHVNIHTVYCMDNQFISGVKGILRQITADFLFWRGEIFL